MGVVSALLLLLWASLAWGAISEVGSSVSCNAGTAPVTSLTCAHDAGNAAQRVTVLGIAKQTNAANPTLVQYGGQNMTFLVRQNHSGTGIGCEMWYLINPPTGSNQGRVDFAAGQRYVIGLATFAGVDQTTPFGGSNSAESPAIGTTASVDVSSASGRLVIDTVARIHSTNELTPGANQNEEWEDATTNATVGNNVRGASSTEAGAAMVTMSWTWTSSQGWAMCAGDLMEVATTLIRHRRVTIGGALP